MLNLQGRQCSSEFTFATDGGKGDPFVRGHTNGFEMFKNFFLVVKQIDRRNLGSGLLKQRLQQLMTEGVQLIFLQHDIGDSGTVLPAGEFRLNRFSKSIEGAGQHSELIGRDITTADVQIATSILLRQQSQFF